MHSPNHRFPALTFILTCGAADGNPTFRALPATRSCSLRAPRGLRKANHNRLQVHDLLETLLSNRIQESQPTPDEIVALPDRARICCLFLISLIREEFLRVFDLPKSSGTS
jgi:hypothetical protein